MKKQILLSAIGILIVIGLFYWGKIIGKKSIPIAQPTVSSQTFNISAYHDAEKADLSVSQRLAIDNLEKKIEYANSTDKLLLTNSLSSFWRDSVQNPTLYAYYAGLASELENSEKYLTFAAQLFLDFLRGEHEGNKADWMASRSLELFNKALAINPYNDDLKVGIGSVYIFGKGKSGNPEETMKGILQLLEVVRKDSNNMKAQLMLGIGGFVSGQYGKAENRLLKVIEKEPGNLEAVAFLADTYAAQGKKAEAVRYYQISKRLANNPQYSKEVDERIKTLE